LVAAQTRSGESAEGEGNPMISREDLARLAKEIAGLGYYEETASHYACLIGDTPCVDEHGRIVVIDGNGRELARFKLQFYGDEG
jgi:hypothetical protein